MEGWLRLWRSHLVRSQGRPTSLYGETLSPKHPDRPENREWPESRPCFPAASRGTGLGLCGSYRRSLWMSAAEVYAQGQHLAHFSRREAPRQRAWSWRPHNLGSLSPVGRAERVSKEGPA